MKKALIVQGGWDGHEPQLTSKRFAGLLEKHGYECVISDTLDALADLDSLLKLDLIVSCWTMGEICHDYVVNVCKAVGAAAFMICRGHESWHPDPAFYYQHGGGPMMDMGPYYLTAMINLLGGVSSVMGVTKASFPTRTITSQPKCGEVVKVEVPTYVTGILNFENGATGTIFTTFDVCYPGQARLEIYGTKGTLFAPDPNTFGGPVRLLRQEGGEVREVPLCFDYAENSRALGLADMAKALRTGRDPRESWKQTLHVLEIMQSFEKSSRSGAAVAIESKYTRGEPMSDEGVRGILN